MRGKVIFLVIVWTFFSGCLLAAMDIEGGLTLTTVRMATLNAEIDHQNELLHADLPPLHVGWGGKLGVVFPIWRFPLESHVGGRVLSPSVEGAGETVQASIAGIYAGATYSLGSWRIGADVGSYRSGLSFPLAGYDGLTGGGWGVLGRVEYTFRFFQRFLVGIGFDLCWLPIDTMVDAFGMTYLGRGGPFLDFSGIGISVGLSWVGF